MTYSPGQPVRISSRHHEGHHRTPAYVKGRTGTIERLHGSFRDPETRAYGHDGLPERELYRVGLVDERGHRIYLDVFEHWLEPAG